MARGASPSLFASAGDAGAGEGRGLGSDSEERVAALSFGEEVCILRWLVCLPLQFWTADIQYIGAVCLCATLESADSGHCIQNAGLIVMRDLDIEKIDRKEKHKDEIPLHTERPSPKNVEHLQMPSLITLSRLSAGTRRVYLYGYLRPSRKREKQSPTSLAVGWNVVLYTASGVAWEVLPRPVK